MIGTRLRKVDLHMHTPASTDFKDRGATASDIVTAALSKGIEAVAVTDHNTFGWVLGLRRAASKRGLVVFPGFEINAVGGHVIAIFDPQVDLATMETALIECGVPKASWGDEGFLARSISEVTGAVSRCGGLSIAAHADGPKGILNAIQQGAARMRAFNDPNLSAVEFSTAEKLERYSGGKVRGYQRTIAFVQGSDAHRLSEIGRRSVLLRMDHLSLEGLRQAFADPEARVKVSTDKAAPTYAMIERITVDSGFLQGQEIEFNPSLNCLVGGAGSGKSTIVEFLRFALDQSSGVESIADDWRGKLRDLAGLGATITVGVRTASGDQFEIRRLYDGERNPVSVTRTDDGSEVGIGDVSGFFPVFAYSQGEVTAICRSALAQLELIDRHLDLSTYLGEIGRARSWMERQAPLIARTHAATQDREAIQKELSAARARIGLLSEELRRLRNAKKDKAVVAHQLWISEEAFWSDLAETLSATAVSIGEGMDAIELPVATVALPDDKTPNRPAMERAYKRVEQIEQERSRLKSAWLTKVADIADAVGSDHSKWKASFSTHNAEYRKAASARKSDRLTHLTSELTGLRKASQRLTRRMNEVTAAQTQLKRQVREWERKLDLVEDQRVRIRVLREKKAKDLMRKVGDRVSLRYLADGNRTEYQELIASVLRGSHAQKSVSARIAGGIKPRELSRLAQENASRKLALQAEVDENWGEELTRRLQADLEALYRLAAAKVEDSLEIAMRVGATEYRSLDKLSTGQKATVIVLLSMAEGQAPIVFDQPEDALYTPFIYTDVVKTLREGKDRRQFILATHNPNIAVGADVDLGIVLEGDASQSSVAATGGLDDGQTRELLLLHLEGGEAALKVREVKFGLGGAAQRHHG